ncbi:biotin/lipoyl-binding protein, partial [Pseudomonas aeruginosa]|nr:biotin/lipoyl-binding protein [Pseudomonas aeruginosa]
MSRVWKIVLLVVAILVLAVVGLRVIGGGKDKAGKPAAGARQGGEDPNAGPVPVTVVEATRQDVPVYASALGTVTAMNTVTVSPQIGGQLMSLNFREGQEVKQGDVLAVIDPRTAQASYDQAAAAKRQNEALLAT